MTTALAACAGEKPAEPPAQPVEKPAPTAAPAPPTWEARLGQTVTIEGVAEPRKLGAYLAGDREHIWIDGLQDWPADLVGRRVRVTGRVIARSDMPVFVKPPPGEPMPAGIAVPPGTDLERAARRFLLADATWNLVQ
jgi:hypothetical protein